MRSIKANFKIDCPNCFSKITFNVNDTQIDLNERFITCPDCGEHIVVYRDRKWLVEHDFEVNPHFEYINEDLPIQYTTVSTPNYVNTTAHNYR